MASTSLLLPFVLLFLLALGSVSGNFSFVNSGELADNVLEYNGSYRVVPLQSSNDIFHMVFFNATPNAYALGIAMGDCGQAEPMMIVWAANRNDLVQDNAILKYGTDGNLVLSNAEGRLVWSTNTSNKGVMGIELRIDGNLVLYDKNKKTVWQSFDYPTDTLLVGQSLNIGGVKKLVSRVSDRDGSEGPYSLVMEAGGFVLYGSFPDPLPNWTVSFYDVSVKDIHAITHTCKKPVSSITFLSDPEAKNGYRQEIEMRLANFTAAPKLKEQKLCNFISEETTTALYGFNTPRVNTTLSFLRLESDGDLKMYTYSPHMKFNKWDITYRGFDCWRGEPDQCDLPRKFGGSAVGKRCQCVACAKVDAFNSWSPNCPPSSQSNCKDGSSNSSVGFYKLVGAESSKDVYPNRNSEECRRRCSHDCTWAASLYWEESSACLDTQNLGNSNQIGDRTNLVFIKTIKA